VGRDWRVAASAIAILVGGLVGGVAGAAAAAAPDTSWARMVRDDGWGDGTVTSGGDMIIFRRAAPKGPGGQPRLQLRYEYRDGVKMGGKTYLSMLALDEYDCKAGRFRSLRIGAFTDHNAQGELRQQSDAAPAWETPSAGTVDAKSLAVACGGR
jgi:hypothetical protein